VPPAAVRRRQHYVRPCVRGQVSGIFSGRGYPHRPGRAEDEPVAEPSAVRKARLREAERRRQAVSALAIGECACRYAKSELANGLDPAAARELVAEMAGELAAVAQVLRRVGWLTVAERRSLAILMAGRGMPTQQIADRLGVSTRSVRNYVRGRSPAKRRPGA
jgi:DNA-binding CsgD family transcriptional regulator